MSKKKKNVASDEEEMDEELSDAIAENDPTAFMASLAKQMAQVNRNMANMQQEWGNTVANAVAPLTIKVDASLARMDSMEARHSADLAKLKESKHEQVSRAVEEKIKELTKTPDQDRASYAGAAAARPGPAATKKGPSANESTNGNKNNDGCSDWLWNARRCLRLFPITGKDDDELKCQLEDFLTNKLRIPTGNLTKDDFKYLRRIKMTRRSKITDKVLVSFTSVRARDLVQSYARNLGQWTDDKGKPTAGIRMEIPDKLIGDHKALEQYGHAMKEKHKEGFKRHIKIDDARQCLYMDVYIPKQKQWARVDMDLVREDNNSRAAKKARTMDKRTLTTAGSSEEEEEKDE